MADTDKRTSLSHRGPKDRSSTQSVHLIAIYLTGTEMGDIDKRTRLLHRDLILSAQGQNLGWQKPCPKILD